MKRFNFTNADLRGAAAVVCNAMLEQQPDLSECRHTFSDEFEQKMRELMELKSHRSTWHKFAHRAAAVILVVLLGLGSWLAVNQDARATVVRWLREVYENSIVYRFFGDSSAEKNYSYEMNWLPDGYELADQLVVGDTQIFVFQCQNEVFTFTYHKVSENSLVELTDVGANVKKIKIRNIDGYYYPAADDTTTNALVWIDDISGMYCCVSAHLDYDDILHIAESMKLLELPK